MKPIHSTPDILALAEIRSEEPCVVKCVRDWVIHPETLDANSVMRLGAKTKLTPATKLGFIGP
ncbi:MAG: hypothetical protein ACM3JB_10075 [Acidobacteriaceae bacterium]